MTFKWTCNADCTWFECEPGDGWRLKIERIRAIKRLEYWMFKWVLVSEISGQKAIGRTDNLSDAFAEAQSAYMKHKTIAP